MTPHNTGDRVMIWRLVAVLSGNREVPITEGEERLHIAWSWSYSWKKFRDDKGIESAYGLMGIVLGAFLKTAWDWFKKRHLKPTVQPDSTPD